MYEVLIIIFFPFFFSDCLHVIRFCSPLTTTTAAPAAAADPNNADRCVSDIVAALIVAHEEGKDINLNKLKSDTSKKHKCRSQPRLTDIIAAVPNTHRKALLPKLKCKPVRTASGIAVVAVMCKPHRCPHIAMTGNICVYVTWGGDIFPSKPTAPIHPTLFLSYREMTLADEAPYQCPLRCR